MEVASKLAAGICMKKPPSLVLETFYVLFGETESHQYRQMERLSHGTCLGILQVW